MSVKSIGLIRVKGLIELELKLISTQNFANVVYIQQDKNWGSMVSIKDHINQTSLWPILKDILLCTK